VRKKRRRKKPQGKNIIACPITYGGHNNNITVCTYFNNKQIQTSVHSIKYTNDFLTTKYLIKFQIIHLTIDLNVLAHVLDGYDVFVFLSF